MTKTMCILVCLLCLVACSGSDHSHPAPAEAASKVQLYDNLGSYSHPVTTKLPLAQQYFDQGFRLVYGFNHEEARKGFEEAARLDPTCAMAWWGVAYTLGPNINWPTDPEREKQAVEAIAKARAAAAGVSQAERDYIEALATRYSNEPTPDRAAKDLAYSKAMRELSKKYPDDLDAATLFGEAMMDTNPWKLWTKEGLPAPGTNEIVATFESVLARNPDHPGANHYYIHAVEASPQPERALGAAERIGTLVPGAGHLVHMPAHIYQRTGHYDLAVEANRKAAEVDREYMAKTGDHGLYPMMYYSHNLQFLAASAAMEGRSAEAIQAARDLGKHVTPEMVKEMPMVEFVAPDLLWTLVHFGKWDDILKEPAPSEHMLYTTGMWHYARGLALDAKGDRAGAQQEQKALEEIRTKIPADLMMNLNYAAPLLEIATHVLAGRMAARDKKWDEAVRQLEAGVRLEDDLNYDEPPAWFTPVRIELGNVHLLAGHPAQAEAVFREDLRKHNPGNGWSIHGLAKSLRAQGRTSEAEVIEKAFQAAWARADVDLGPTS